MKKITLLALLILSIFIKVDAQYSIMYDLQQKQITLDSIQIDSITKIEFYYIPWDINSYSAFSENEIRDFNGKTSYFNIELADSIKDFVEYFSIYNFSLYEKEKTKFNKKNNKLDEISFDPRMVIDFIFKSGCKETVSIDRNGNLFYKGQLYFSQMKFCVFICETVPEAERKWWDY